MASSEDASEVSEEVSAAAARVKFQELRSLDRSCLKRVPWPFVLDLAAASV